MTARPAGFWIRAVAALLDFAVFAFVQLSFALIGGRMAGPDVESTGAFRPLVGLFTIIFAGAYTTVLHALGGQTIGKMIAGVRVVVDDGDPPPLGTALLRFLGYFASGAVFTLGFVMAGLRHDKRALHDLIAGTRVERVPRAAVAAPTEPHLPAEPTAAAGGP
jgi:uncharacterized RDD family membrane protein YckC